MKSELTVKEYLMQLQDIDISINQDLNRLHDMKLQASCGSGIDYAKDRVQTSPKDRLCEDVTNFVSFDEKINQRIDLYVNAKETIIDQIRGLHNPVYNQILFNVYVKFMSLKVCSVEMKKSYQYIREQHTAALHEFGIKYDNLFYLT